MHSETSVIVAFVVFGHITVLGFLSTVGSAQGLS